MEFYEARRHDLNLFLLAWQFIDDYIILREGPLGSFLVI